jgi:hypothetical protein
VDHLCTHRVLHLRVDLVRFLCYFPHFVHRHSKPLVTICIHVVAFVRACRGFREVRPQTRYDVSSGITDRWDRVYNQSDQVLVAVSID